MLAANKKYYCTNVDNHLRDMFPKGKDDWSHVLYKTGGYYNHPAVPYAIGYEVQIPVETLGKI